MPSSARREQESIVTESDWLSSTDPQAMLSFLRDRGPVSERKLRLFAVSCCRRLHHLYSDPQVVEVLGFVEVALEGAVEPEALATAQAKMGDSVEVAWVARYDAEADANFCSHPAYTLAFATEFAVYAAGRLFDDMAPSWLPRTLERGFSNAREVHEHAVEAIVQAATARAERGTTYWASTQPFIARVRWSELYVQADMLRDIFGNPFRPAPFSPEWRTEAVVALARAIYEERAWDRMGVLADALEDAGCDSAEVLEHCRGGGPHVRGCWLIDEVLQKG
jgi:hypothetical protein